MAAPYSDLQSKVEAALKAEAEQVSLSNRGGAAVYVGLNANIDTDENEIELPLPRIECHAEQGDEDPPESGNFWMACEVAVYSTGNVELPTHRSRTAYVFDQFMSDLSTITTNLTGRVTDFTCIGIKDRQRGKPEKDGRAIVNRLTFMLLCCPKDF